MIFLILIILLHVIICYWMKKKHFFINQLWAIEDEKNSIYVTPDEISISIDGDNLKLPY